MGTVLLVFQLIQAVLGTVHAIEVQMGAANGAQKSQNAMDKLAPWASMLNMNAAQLQSFVDAAVSFFNVTGIFKAGGGVATPGAFSVGALLSHLFTAPPAPVTVNTTAPAITNGANTADQTQSSAGG